MAELAGKSVVVKVSGAAVAMTGEATTATGNISYQISNAAKQVIDWETPPTVLDGGVETVEDYTVNYLNGTITFGTTDTRTITVTGFYRPMSAAAYANAISDTGECDMLDKTVFLDTYRKRMAGLLSKSGTLTHINVIDETFSDALAAGDPVVIETRGTAALAPDRVLAMLNSNQISAAVDGLQNAVVSWTSTDAWIRLGG